VTNNNNNSTSTSETMGTMGSDYGPLLAYALLRQEGSEKRRYEREEKDEEPRRGGGTSSARRSGDRAPVTRIWSGEALNDMLDELSSLQGKGYSPPLVVLDRDVRERVNVATVHGGNAGLFKNKDQLDWPRCLQGSEFEEARTVLGEAAEEAVKQASSRSYVGRDVLIALDGGIDELGARIKGLVNVVPPSEYIEAKRFVRHLGDASKALKQPDAASYFNQTYAAKGRTVEQLVKNMTAQELRFAPATPGSEQAYLKLYRALALCTVAIQEDFGQD
jgi:hypothetical protein